jgi:hypothetical protein
MSAVAAMRRAPQAGQKPRRLQEKVTNFSWVQSAHCRKASNSSLTKSGKPAPVSSQQPNVPVILANARLSNRSMKGYQRLSQITREMLTQLAVIATQTHEDANTTFSHSNNSNVE